MFLDWCGDICVVDAFCFIKFVDIWYRGSSTRIRVEYVRGTLTPTKVYPQVYILKYFHIPFEIKVSRNRNRNV